MYIHSLVRIDLSFMIMSRWRSPTFTVCAESMALHTAAYVYGHLLKLITRAHQTIHVEREY